jgi:F-type H+-transporting ATPase subunit a
MFIGTAYAAADHGLHPVFSPFGIDVMAQIFTMWFVMAFIILVSVLATRNIQKYPSGVQNLMEFFVETLTNLFDGIMGGKGKSKKYLPFLGSMFLLILASNYSGLLPGAGMYSAFMPPTNTLSVTLALALCTFFATHYYGVKEKGLKYFKHFIQPYPFFLPLNLLEEVVRPLSLSLRLFGNVFGEEMVAAVLFGLIPFFLPVPAQLLGVLFGGVQAFVFTLLSAIYIGTATAGGH